MVSIVETLHQIGLHSFLERHALDVPEAAEQFVRAVGDRVGHVGRGGAAGDRIVFEAAVGGRVVRGGDHDAVGQPLAIEALGAVRRAVVGQNRLGDDWRGGEVVARVDAHRHAIGNQHLDCGLERRLAQGVGVAADIQRAGYARFLAVFRDGLGDGDDMRLVERGLQRRAAMAGRAERDALFGNFRVGDDIIILSDDLVDIDQICWGGGLSRIVCNHIADCTPRLVTCCLRSGGSARAHARTRRAFPRRSGCVSSRRAYPRPPAPRPVSPVSVQP